MTSPTNYSFLNFKNFFVDVEYYLGEKGEVCNDEKDVIRSHNECYIAIHKLGLQVSEEDAWTGTLSAEIPTGCSMRQPSILGGMDIDFHFEKTTHGLGTGRNDLRPVCIKPGNTGFLYKTNLSCRYESYSFYS